VWRILDFDLKFCLESARLNISDYLATVNSKEAE